MRSIWVLAFMLSLAEAARPMLSSMPALEGDAALPCKERNAENSGHNKCKCNGRLVANELCPEGDVGKEKFTLSKETSPYCYCEEECRVKYDARDQLWQNGHWMCKCTKASGRFPHELCGVPWGSTAAFPLEPAKDGCRCLHFEELNKFRPTAPVRVAALNLCRAFWEKVSRSDVWPELTPDMCKKVVAEGLAPPEQKWLQELKDTSKAEHRGYGRLDPLVGTAVHHHLGHVCADECQTLVERMANKGVRDEIKHDIVDHGASFTEACADRVVRQVEANVLGCCADSCGYNGRSCLAWPFFTKAEKVTWLEECCTEFNVLSGSPRELMCNSVLNPDQAKKVSATDVKLKRGVDVGGPYTGQGPPLLWTEKGVNSELGKYYAQSQKPPKTNGPVSSQVMEEHPHIRAEALEKQWFTEKEIIQSDSGHQATSFMEASANACDFSKAAHCTDTFKQMKHESCLEQRKWKVSAKVREGKRRGCPKGDVRHMETPDECFKVFPNEPNVKSFFFEFVNEGQQKDENLLDEKSLATPISCYVDTTDCGKDIQKVSITELDKADGHILKDSTFWFDAKDLQEGAPGPKDQ